MARRKKSGTGGVLGAVVLGALALLMVIPREVWIGAGALVAVALVIYLLNSLSKAKAPEKPGKAARDAESPAARRLQEEAPRRVASSPSASSFKIPTLSRDADIEGWIPAGQRVVLRGLDISGGMVYVGTSLPTPYGSNDPSLIDTSKPVAKKGDYTERQFGYWPSYSEISPGARRAYLGWLADGRQDPEADIGYVFLFFYGLERRAILDGAQNEAAQADWPVIANELRRLLSIYGQKSHSFRRYAGELLDWVSLASHPAKLYERPVPELPKSFELPLYVRLALGQAAVDGVPVPAHLALSWARLDPTVSLRMPAIRCAEQFGQLFPQKYAELFGSGMVLPKNRTKLKLVYQAASAGFRGYQELKLTFRDTPDVTVLTAPIEKLRQVVEAATKPLDAYSRTLAKNPDGKASLEALLQLPAHLWPETAQQALRGLKERMGDGMLTLLFSELLAILETKTSFTKERTVSLARALESAGVGFEPDVLGGAKPPKPDEPVVLFTSPPTEALQRASGPYVTATLTLQLASAVATADGEFGVKEFGHLRETVLSWSHLTPAQTRRLLAHLRMLMLAPASLTALKKKLEPLEMAVRESLAASMAAVAQADGEVSPAEVKILEKVYRALGVDPKKVFADVHAVAAGIKFVMGTAGPAETSFRLDPTRIAALQRDTDKVSAMLASIFTEVAAAAPPPPEPVAVPEEASGAERLLGLDEAHAALARMLLSRPQWSREELLDVAADLDLMLDGALEHLNDAALDLHDMPLIEGEDPVTVNSEILEKVDA